MRDVREEFINELAYQLALMDGLDDSQMYHVVWSGGWPPEPEGSVLDLHYLPKAAKMADELLRVIFPVEVNLDGSS